MNSEESEVLKYSQHELDNQCRKKSDERGNGIPAVTDDQRRIWLDTPRKHRHVANLTAGNFISNILEKGYYKKRQVNNIMDHKCHILFKKK